MGERRDEARERCKVTSGFRIFSLFTAHRESRCHHERRISAAQSYRNEEITMHSSLLLSFGNFDALVGLLCLGNVDGAVCSELLRVVIACHRVSKQ